MKSKLLFPRWKDLIPRGGSTIVQVDKSVIIFGGVNREQVHLSDMWIIDLPDNAGEYSTILYLRY